LLAKAWAWKTTQYDEKTAIRPTSEQSYRLIFSPKGKFIVDSSCGSWKGNYTFAGKAMDISMKRSLRPACRKDESLKIFLDDLQRSRFAYIEDNKLRITLAGSGGIIFFEAEHL